MDENKNTAISKTISTVSEISKNWYSLSKNIENVISGILTCSTYHVKGVICNVIKSKYNQLDVTICDDANENNDTQIKIVADLPSLNRIEQSLNKTVLMTIKPVIKTTNIGFITNLKLIEIEYIYNSSEAAEKINKANTEIFSGLSTSIVKKAHEFPAQPKVLILSPTNGLVLNDIKNIFLKYIKQYNDKNYKNFLVNLYKNIHEESCYITDLNSIYSKLKEINAQNEYNVLIIARGGSGDTIAKIFNNEAIVTELVKFNGYIMTGIGHSDSLTIADCIANECYDTPATLATFFHEKIRKQYWEATNQHNEVCEGKSKSKFSVNKIIFLLAIVAYIFISSSFIVKYSAMFTNFLRALINSYL